MIIAFLILLFLLQCVCLIAISGCWSRLDRDEESLRPSALADEVATALARGGAGRLVKEIHRLFTFGRWERGH